MSKAVVMCTWDDVPHLTEAAKADMLSAYHPHMRDARSKGIPALGSGAIYPVPESDWLIPPFDIPAHWPRAYGMDVGWKMNAVMWGAWDRETDCLFIYDEYYRGQAEPSTHAAAIRRRGEWMQGVIDPASRGRGQDDGEQLMIQYQDQGLHITKADNGVEAGLYAVYERLSTGRLKVFAHCANFRMEAKLYRRDEKGNIVKRMDHAMDATRYLVMSGLDVASPTPSHLQLHGTGNKVTSDYDPYQL